MSANSKMGLRVASGVDPAIVALARRMKEQRVSASVVSDRAGINICTLQGWCYGTRGGTLVNVRAALNAVGLDLAVVERRG